MNILSFDIEEWYLEQILHGGRKEKFKEFDFYLHTILEQLEQRGIQATFFCLGNMANFYPQVVKLIQSKGHEIGCHSNSHQWLNKMDYNQVNEDTHAAVDALQQLIGKKVTSYRAPAFSIGEKNLWTFEVLAQNGIERDASVFPATRDFGGFSTFGYSAPTKIRYNGIEIKEFPVSTTNLLGKTLVYSGGGYFRLFPLPFIKSRMLKSSYTMTYFHLLDLIREKHTMKSKQEYEEYFKERGSLLNRGKRYIKANLGTAGAFNKFQKLVNQTDFISVEKADAIIDWQQVNSKTF